MHPRFFHFIIISAIIVLCSCKNEQENNKKIFRYNESAGITTLDPAFAKNQAIMWPVHQLYNTLVEVDEQMKIIPSLAKSWSISADKKTIEFQLRNDVYFHDDPCFHSGKKRKMNAGDVAYSFSRIVNPAVASPGAWIFNNIIDTAQPFLALTDSTFQLKLRQPFSAIMGLLSMQYCSIVSRQAVEYYGQDFRKHPVGTGPFQFVAWHEGQALVLKKNQNYFEKDADGKSLPYLDGISISFLGSKTSEFLAFRQNKIDFINDMDPSFKDELLNKKGELTSNWKSKISISKKPYLNIEYLGILTDTLNPVLKNSPLKLKKIRLAINYAIDRSKMIFYLRNSIGYPANSGFVPLGMGSFDSVTLKGYAYDPEKSMRLIKECGFSEKNPMPEIKLVTVPNYAGLGTYIVNDLKKTGINISLEIVQKSLLLEQMSKSQISFFRGSWIADYPDEINFLSVFYSKNPSPPNYTRFSNTTYDSLYEAALVCIDENARNIIYRKMQQIIMEEAPVVPLWYDMSLRLYQKNLKEFNTNALNMLELRRVVKK